MSTQTLEQLLADYPRDVTVSASSVREADAASPAQSVLIVLDDDPTGTQSVADLPVLTAWEEPDLRWALSTGAPAVYVMTNSRSLSARDAEKINRDVVRAALDAAKELDRRVTFVSRSDSTLRGHFPLEPNVLAEEVEAATHEEIDGILIVPAFGDAGRITVGGVHYAGSAADGFVPVGETEFAKDATFGYRNSRLVDWVEEKTDGEILAADVIAIPLSVLRADRDETVRLLRSASSRQPIVVDIVTEDDLRLLSLALIEAESAGSRYIYRVGPPFVRARIGQEVHAPLTEAEIEAARGGREPSPHGLVVVGSHVGLTTRQLNTLRDARSLIELEIDVAKVLGPDRDEHLGALVDEAVAGLSTDTVVVRTSRLLVTGADADDSLSISRQVSAAVVDVVQGIVAQTAPRFVIAKGGITSSDVASKGLGIRRAFVVGPMLPGIVSMWSGQDGRAEGVPYIVFAGNVGDESSLATVVDTLSL